MEQLRSAPDPEETEERSSSTFTSTTTPTAALMSRESPSGWNGNRNTEAPPAVMTLEPAERGVQLAQRSTISRRLHHAGLHAHRPLPRLSLTPRHRHQRLQWCRTRLSWSDSEWQRVIFSDESRFSLGGDAQRIRVWRHRGQHQDERFVVTRPEGLVSLHRHPYRTICRNCVRMFKLHGMDYHRTPSGTSTAPYRDVWRVGLANTAARRHTERQTSSPSEQYQPAECIPAEMPLVVPVTGESYCQCPTQTELNSQTQLDTDTQECTCGEDETGCVWAWDEEYKSPAVFLSCSNRKVSFHPDYSCGTAAIRGSAELRHGQHFWEVKMTSPVYGTDMMVGIGTPEVNLAQFRHSFCSMLGADAHSWGLSYTGLLHHKGSKISFSPRFGQGSIIGLHLDTWHGTLTFYKNRRWIAATGLRNKSFYPMVCSTAAKSSMKVISSVSTPTSLQYLCCSNLRRYLPDALDALSALPIPPGLKLQLRQQLGWVLRLRGPEASTRTYPEDRHTPYQSPHLDSASLTPAETYLTSHPDSASLTPAKTYLTSHPDSNSFTPADTYLTSHPDSASFTPADTYLTSHPDSTPFTPADTYLTSHPDSASFTPADTYLTSHPDSASFTPADTYLTSHPDSASFTPADTYLTSHPDSASFTPADTYLTSHPDSASFTPADTYLTSHPDSASFTPADTYLTSHPDSASFTPADTHLTSHPDSVSFLDDATSPDSAYCTPGDICLTCHHDSTSFLDDDAAYPDSAYCTPVHTTYLSSHPDSSTSCTDISLYIDPDSFSDLGSCSDSASCSDSTSCPCCDAPLSLVTCGHDDCLSSASCCSVPGSRPVSPLPDHSYCTTSPLPETAYARPSTTATGTCEQDNDPDSVWCENEIDGSAVFQLLACSVEALRSDTLPASDSEERPNTRHRTDTPFQFFDASHFLSYLRWSA
ncbi:hypothetical protein NFI96_001252 [Prochilodus magdalenae]|nr:hypothetical protein NFI96_001252 [Prochilodus magdalenae]